MTEWTRRPESIPTHSEILIRYWVTHRQYENGQRDPSSSIRENSKQEVIEELERRGYSHVWTAGGTEEIWSDNKLGRRYSLPRMVTIRANSRTELITLVASHPCDY